MIRAAKNTTLALRWRLFRSQTVRVFSFFFLFACVYRACVSWGDTITWVILFMGDFLRSGYMRLALCQQLPYVWGHDGHGQMCLLPHNIRWYANAMSSYFTLFVIIFKASHTFNTWNCFITFFLSMSSLLPDLIHTTFGTM